MCRNPFANGAGLGMSICQTIIRRMGGDIDVRSVLGKGTTIAITLPIEFLPSPSSDSATPTSSTLSTPTPTPTRSRLSPGLIRTRIISQELATLFNPGPAHLVNSVSPGHEPKELDFSQAVEAAQSSSTLVRMPSSRTRPRRGSVVGRRGDVDDLVVEAAKLGFSTAVVEEEGRESSSESPPEKAGAELGSSAAAASQAGRKVRVLVADDNPIARNIFTKLFTNKVRSCLPSYGPTSSLTRCNARRESISSKPRMDSKRSSSSRPPMLAVSPSISTVPMYKCHGWTGPRHRSRSVATKRSEGCHAAESYALLFSLARHRSR